MSAAAEPEPFVDADAVAAFLCIKRRQVLELARTHKIPAHALLGSRRKMWRFKLSEVDAAVASGTRQPPTPCEDGALAHKSTPSKMRLGSPRSQRRNSNG
jgi:predicted DNA-binding transcriptional regulator AlpA